MKRAREIESGFPHGKHFPPGSIFSASLAETLFGLNPNRSITGDLSQQGIKTPSQLAREEWAKSWSDIHSKGWQQVEREQMAKKWASAGRLVGSDNPMFDFFGRATGEQFGPLESGQSWQMLQAGISPSGSTRMGKSGGRFDRPSTGSLAAIGGLYFGADYNTRLMSNAEKQVRELERISSNTKETADSLKQ
jgi:hypothetical protein